MGTAPEGNPGPTVKCMICGRENPAERRYCYHCNQKLHDPIMDKMRTELQAAHDENERLRQLLEPVQTENQQLRQQLEPLRDELGKLKEPSVNPDHVAELTSSLNAAKEEAARHLSHAEGWKDEWKVAKEKAAEFEAKLAAKTKEFEEFIKKNPGTKQIPYLKSIVAFITLLGSLAGYGTGRYVQPKDDSSGKINELVSQVANAQKLIGDLNSALKAAKDKADQVQNQSKTDLDSANAKNSDLSTHQQQLQHQLNDANQKASIADQNQRQLREELDSANRRITALTASEQQLEHQVADANAQKATANQSVGQLNAEVTRLRAQVAPKGSLVWSGNLSGKRTINIKNGVPDFGALSGALPQRLCKVSTLDDRVKIKNRPSKNHLNDLSFDVSGLGLVQVRIDFEISE